MTRGSKIAHRVAKGLAKAGKATGGAPLTCVIKRPATGGPGQLTPRQIVAASQAAPELHQVGAMRTTKQIRDANGTLIGKAKTVLVIETTGVAPLKSDLIAVGVKKADVTESTAFHKIEDIQTTAPGDTALMYKVTLED